MPTRFSSRPQSRGSRPYSSDPRVGGASCNIAISNEHELLWTGLQSVEYLMSISAGRSTLDVVDAIACLSGACSMYRRDTFLRQGGLDVGPGEDLEYSLRLRRLGHVIRFVPEAWAETDGPASGISLLAPARAVGSRCLANPFHHVWRTALVPPLRALAGHAAEAGLHPLRSCSHAHPSVLSDLHRAVVWRQMPLLFLGAIYFVLLWISIFNMALAFVMFNRSIGFFGLGASLIFPFYQGVFLKCGRFFAYSSEIMFASSRRDDFVPPRVRRALFGDRA